MSFHAASETGYGVATRALGTDRDVEYRVFGQVTGRLARALEDGTGIAALAEAIHENNRLWTALAVDLAGPDNALSDPLKAQLLGLAIFARKEGDRVLAGGGDLRMLIEINTTIMAGLRATPARAEPE